MKSRITPSLQRSQGIVASMHTSLHIPDQFPRIALISDSPSSANRATTGKPHGLANTRHGVPVTNTVIEDFIYQEGTDESQSDEEQEDGLEYHGSAVECLVCFLCYLSGLSPAATDTPFNNRLASSRVKLASITQRPQLPALVCVHSLAKSSESFQMTLYRL